MLAVHIMKEHALLRPATTVCKEHAVHGTFAFSAAVHLATRVASAVLGVAGGVAFFGGGFPSAWPRLTRPQLWIVLETAVSQSATIGASLAT